MRLAIVGSRSFDNYDLLVEKIDRLFGDINVHVVISGGAKGADSLAAKYAKDNWSNLIEYLPDWNKHGKSAGFIRNELIVKDCDWLLAFWDGESRGTKHSIDIARKLKKPTVIVYF